MNTDTKPDREHIVTGDIATWDSNLCDYMINKGSLTARFIPARLVENGNDWKIVVKRKNPVIINISLIGHAEEYHRYELHVTEALSIEEMKALNFNSKEAVNEEVYTKEDLKEAYMDALCLDHDDLVKHPGKYWFDKFLSKWKQSKIK